jgi:hypothetical protein
MTKYILLVVVFMSTALIVVPQSDDCTMHGGCAVCNIPDATVLICPFSETAETMLIMSCTATGFRTALFDSDLKANREFPTVSYTFGDVEMVGPWFRESASLVYSDNLNIAVDFLNGITQTIFVLFEVDLHMSAVYYGTDGKSAALDFIGQCGL